MTTWSWILVTSLLITDADRTDIHQSKPMLGQPKVIVGWVSVELYDLIYDVFLSSLMEHGLPPSWTVCTDMLRVFMGMEPKEAWLYDLTSADPRVLLLKARYQLANRKIYLWTAYQESPEGKLLSLKVTPEKSWLVHEFEFTEKSVNGRPLVGNLMVRIRAIEISEKELGYPVCMFYVALAVRYNDGDEYHEFPPGQVIFWVYPRKTVHVRRGWFRWPRSDHVEQLKTEEPEVSNP